MGEFGFGRAFNMQERADNRFLIDAIAASNLRTSVYAQFPELTKYKLEKVLYPRGYIMRQKFLDLTREFAESRVGCAKNAKQDLFSFIVDAKDPDTGEGFSLPELWSESKFLIVAGKYLNVSQLIKVQHQVRQPDSVRRLADRYSGSDTSSTVLASALFYLSRYSECYEKLAHEIRSTFSSSSEISMGPKMQNCKYLRACIDETMRMSPPAGGSMWRETEAGGASIARHFIPGGIDVGTSMYAIHHNATYYPKPFEYCPERWLDDVEGPSGNAAKAFNPFSLGSRGCIGRGLAYMEIQDTLAWIFWHADFRKAEGPLGCIGQGNVGRRQGRFREKEFQLEDHLTSQKDGPYLQFRYRITPKEYSFGAV